MLDNNAPRMSQHAKKPAPRRKGGRATNGAMRNGAARDGEARDGAVDLGLLERLVGYQVRRLQLRIFQDFVETMGEHDIRPSQFSVLTVVGANPGLKQTQVSAALGIKRANLVVMLDELERRGLIERARGSADRRSHALHLTRAGKQLKDRLDALVLRHEEHFVGRIGAEGKRLVMTLIRAMLEP
jgi:DNA-binding MarR family transcriptional regulator